jgi:hypothetical protein
MLSRIDILIRPAEALPSAPLSLRKGIEILNLFGYMGHVTRDMADG